MLDCPTQTDLGGAAILEELVQAMVALMVPRPRVVEVAAFKTACGVP